jgi:methyl-accepting chemotaxis protein
VVATEVKQLAARTEDATRGITETLRELEQRTGRAVQAIGVISEVIGKIERGQRIVNDTVRQQAEATDGVGRSVEEARKVVALIAAESRRLEGSTDDTVHEAEETDEAARQLIDAAAHIREITRHFDC